MARKRFVFLSTVESFVLKLVHQFKSELIFRRWGYRRLVVLLLLGVFLFTAAIPPVLSQMSNTNANNLSVEQVSQLVEQSRQHYENGEFDKAIESLQQAAKNFEKQKDWGNLASTLSNLGLSQLELGQSSAAFKSWEEAERYFSRINGDDKTGIIKSRVYQAQALQSLGLYSRACELLTTTVLDNSLQCDALDEKVNTGNKDRSNWDLLTGVIQKKDNSIQAIVWHSLGDVLRVIGDLDNSEKALKNGLKVAQSEKQKLAMHLSLGNTFRAKGNLERDRRSSPVYDYMPWRYTKKEKFPEAEKYYDYAEKEYKEIINSSSSSILNTQIQLNRLSMLIERGQKEQLEEAQKLWFELGSNQQKITLQGLPKNLMAVYAQVNLGKNLAYLKQASETEKLSWNNAPSWNEIENLLLKLEKEAESLKNERVQSYVLGNLGGLYEYCTQRDDYCLNVSANKTLKNESLTKKNIINKAQQFTQKALLLAQPSKAADIAYQWQWQMGRLLKSESKIEKAITNYKDAVKTLESVRGDLLSISSDVQFSFRDNVEPLYRELIDTLITSFKNVKDNSNGTIEINDNDNFEVPDYIDSLQLAEIENFLRCDLSNKIVITDASKKNKSKAIYPTITAIILKDKLVVTLSVPDKFSDRQKIYLHQEAISSNELEENIKTLRNYLRIASRTASIKEISGKLYNSLIKPFEEYLDIQGNFNDSSINTLVFLLDGSLKNIPMSILYDSTRKRYLLERYATAVAPSLKLLELEPLPDKINVLTGGLSIEAQHPLNSEKIPPLEGVRQELKEIQSQILGEQLLDENFTEKNLTNKIKTGKFSVVHLATHGEFSSDPKKTFILLWGKSLTEKTINSSLKLNAGQSEALYAKGLDNLLRTNTNQKTIVKLLVLSACETAAGDKRAALGLSGLAVRAGARSTIASLWQADDEATSKVMAKFYQTIKENREATRATALREAQLSLWNSNEMGEIWKAPRYWGTYILVGNWL